jgi:DNA-binding NtrC family response regulator
MCVDVGAMPEADGREVVLAAKRSSAKTKVIVYTGFMRMSHAADLFKAGVYDIIDKFDTGPDDLTTKIREILTS